MKKIIAMLLALVMVLGLVACAPANNTTTNGAKPSEGGKPTGGSNTSALEGTYEIKVWVAEKIVDLTKTQIENFNNTNTDGIKIVAKVEAVGESEAATQMTTDVAAGADLYCFAQDQTIRLVQSGALAKLGNAASDIVKAANAAGAVAAVTSDGALYAYPMTADNGYFMYYDKSVVQESSVDSLTAILADLKAANKYFSVEAETSAWYIASWFFATGCHSEWIMEGDQFKSVDDTFNSDKGLIAVKGLKELYDSGLHVSSSAASEFSNNAAVLVTGMWAYEDIKGQLGDNMGVADLPSFTVDGQDYHLGSYAGYKLMGVKPQSDAKKQAALHKLAQYLTSKDCQLERFKAQSWGPSNLEAQQDEAVKANEALSVLNQQNQYATVQGQIHGSWWDIAKVIGTNVKNATDEAGLKKALEDYQAAIEAVFTMSDEVKNAFTVIGQVNGTSWDTDFAMTKQEDGTWKSNEAFELKAGNELKCRQGKAWDVAYPASNYVVEADGTYYVVLDPVAGTVSLLPA